MTIIRPSRRGFIQGLIGIIAAPAIVRASALMPVKVLEPTDSFLGHSYFSEHWQGVEFSKYCRGKIVLMERHTSKSELEPS